MKPAAQAEVMESRQLLSSTGLFIPGTGELNVLLGSQDNLRVNSVSGSVLVETSTGSGNYSPLLSVGTVNSASVLSLVIVGGDDVNTIDLNGVTAAAFTSLTAINVDAANGNDSIIGSPDLADSILGGHGHDTIDGQAGNDTINGGDGDDSITAGDGNDSILGGDGQDSIAGDAGNDTVDSGDGDDTVSGGDDNDSITADNGEDSLNGDAGDDTINGDGGTDTINGDDGNDSILGGEFADSLLGGAGNDTINGQAGNDNIDGGDGDDSIKGGANDDLIFGNTGNDTLNGEAGADQLSGGDGDDSVFGGGGDDLLLGDGVDSTVAGSGNDVLLGQSGNDTLIGGGGGDSLNGGAGNDQVQSYFTGLDEGMTATPTVPGGGGTTLTLVPGTDVNVSRSASTQGETHVAINPTNPLNVVITANGGTTDPAAEFLANSFDGGATWTIRALTFTQDGIGNANSNRFDGAVAFDRFGNLHVTYMARDTSGDSAILHAMSIDGGNTFTTQVLAPLSGFVDKPWIATGPDAANTANEAVYVTYRDAGGIVVRGATITGLGAIGAFSTASLFTPVGNYAVPSVGPNGEFVVTWMNPAGGEGPADLLFDRDLDGLVGGLNFGADTLITVSEAGGFDFIPATPDRSTFASPYLVYDLSNGPFRGRLYCAYADEAPAESNDLDIRLRISDDDGATWSAPIRVNDDATTRSQFFQNISVDPVTGNVFFSWYDARNDAGGLVGIDTDGVPNTDVEVFMTVSTDGGSTFLTNVMISGGASNQIRDFTDPGNDFGDYTGIAAYNNIAYPVWVDNSNSTGDNPGGNQTFEVYVDRVALTTTGGGGGGGGTSIPAVGDTLVGGDGDDTLVGADGDDTINSQGGNDSILGGAGHDSLLGGTGQDTLDGQAGNDTLDGQGSNDTVFGSDGDDTFIIKPNGSGAETIDGGEGLNTAQVLGTTGDDTITVGAIGSALTVGVGSSTLIVNGNLQNVIIDALAGNDTVTVANVNTVGFIQLSVRGGDGDDTLTAAGADIGQVRLLLSGDNGDDTLVGSNGNDTLDGGAGADAANGGAGNDTIRGGLGNDQIGGGSGNDFIDGGDGNDFANGDAGDDNLNGGLGNDTLKGADGADTINGGAGNDNLNGMAGNDSVLGGVGKDALAGGAGNDTLDGGRNDDTISGNSGNDLIRGDHGHDFIDAGDGNNTVNGGDGNDTILAADGQDLINGGDGNDQINAGNGNDIVNGGDGKDSLLGGGGADVILGGDGDDNIDGQGGTDTIAGNQGVDVIVDPASEIDEQFVLSAELLTALEAVG